ncbi:MAG: hopanoid biosynthesis-associated protein HpnK [Gammaproteobacteria bacterium]|nr:hopanoid biosynthesis-associated protein HpnK [Gammaproteobacteria bacterium]
MRWKFGRADNAVSSAALKRLIITADDFGLDVAVNEAVERACRAGVLTTASLMVGAPAADDAVARARRLPELRVGLHVTLVDGRPISSPRTVPDLVGPDGEFSAALFRQGVRFFFLPRVRRQLAAEIRAQFDAFRATGLPLDHVNAHKHMHLHPTVLALILTIGRDYGLRAVRLPHEPWRNAFCLGQGVAGRLAWSIFLAPWLTLMRRRLRRYGLRHNDYLFGLARSGAMDEAALLRLLRCLPDGVSEIYFHPAAARTPELARRMSSYRHEDELAALLSPAVKARLDDPRYRRISFSELHSAAA